MNIVQVDLVAVGKRQDGLKEKRLMTTWVNDRPDLKVGIDIELKNVEGLWRVNKIYSGVRESAEFDWHRKWSNNI